MRSEESAHVARIPHQDDFSQRVFPPMKTLSYGA
jgi:hypothetical protein